MTDGSSQVALHVSSKRLFGLLGGFDGDRLINLRSVLQARVRFRTRDIVMS